MQPNRPSSSTSSVMLPAMPHKSAINPSRRKPTAIPRRPLTTQGKHAKALILAEKALKNVPRDAPTAPFPLNDSTASGKVKRTKKAQSFPPPTELAALELASRREEAAIARRLATRNGHWDFSISKPLTNTHKLAQARAIRASKGGSAATVGPTGHFALGKGNGDEQQLSLGEKAMLLKTGEESNIHQNGGRKKNVKMPGTCTVMRYHKPSMLKWDATDNGDGVLERATRRAEPHRRRSARANQAFSIAGEPGKAKDYSGKGLLNLPLGIRTSIWKYVVVLKKSYIWPASPMGWEQPDLAMTCREIRDEVLPIFYGQNIFAVMISPEVYTPSRGTVKNGEAGKNMALERVPLGGIVAVQKWAEVLQAGGWLHKIKNWAFDFVDPETSTIGSKSPFNEDDESFVISLQLGQAGRTAGNNVEFRRDGRRARVDIHRSGMCVLSGWSRCGTCTVQRTPKEAVSVVIENLELDALTPDGICRVAKQFQNMSSKLRMARCRKYGHLRDA